MNDNKEKKKIKNVKKKIYKYPKKTKKRTYNELKSEKDAPPKIFNYPKLKLNNENAYMANNKIIIDDNSKLLKIPYQTKIRNLLNIVKPLLR